MDHGPPEPRQKRRLQDRAGKDRDLHDRLHPKRLLNWRLDWRAYFRRFAEVHGGNPVEVDGKLVFPDGWSYSSTDYKGPEWPPPVGADLFDLMSRYWRERAGIVRDELKLLRITRQSVIDQSGNRSVPLMKKVKRFGDENAWGVRKVLWQSEELDLANVDERIAWLEADLRLSDEVVKGLPGTVSQSQYLELLDRAREAADGTASEALA